MSAFWYDLYCNIYLKDVDHENMVDGSSMIRFPLVIAHSVQTVISMFCEDRPFKSKLMDTGWFLLQNNVNLQ